MNPLIEQLMKRRLMQMPNGPMQPGPMPVRPMQPMVSPMNMTRPTSMGPIRMPSPFQREVY